jgi:hypothetical protein
MSFDLNLTTVCDHAVFRELMVVDQDLHTLRTDKPLASAGTVKVYATDNLLPSSMYYITDDPQDKTDKVIYLKDKWRSPTDYFEVSYVTILNYCPKCVGSKYLDDITYNVMGDFVVTRDEALLMQNVEKFTVTVINSNPFHVYIGTSLVNLIGTRVSNISFMVSQITAEITRGLQKFQNLQAQYKLTGRDMTPGETLDTINSIQVTQDTNDPTIMRATVSVTAESGKPGEFTQYLKIRT